MSQPTTPMELPAIDPDIQQTQANLTAFLASPEYSQVADVHVLFVELPDQKTEVKDGYLRVLYEGPLEEQDGELTLGFCGLTLSVEGTAPLMAQAAASSYPITLGKMRLRGDTEQKDLSLVEYCIVNIQRANISETEIWIVPAGTSKGGVLELAIDDASYVIHDPLDWPACLDIFDPELCH